MDNQLCQYLEKAFYFEKNGYINEAIQLCNKCIEVFPQNKCEIEFEVAKMKYRIGQRKDALDQLIKLYQETEEETVCNLIMDVYYRGHQEEFLTRYQKNCEVLGKYRYFFGKIDSEKIQNCPVYMDGTVLVYFDSAEGNFKSIRRYAIPYDKLKDVTFLASDILWVDDIMALERGTRKVNPIFDEENPLLLVYQGEAIWELLMQTVDLENLTVFERIIFYKGVEWLEPSFLEEGIFMPHVVLGREIGRRIGKILTICAEKYEQEYKKYYQQAKVYYQENGEEILKHIREKKPKILFITSRFSTALQYHIRDCEKAAEELGLETVRIIEKDRLSTGYGLLFRMRKISEMRPDVIFTMDHFRYEQSYMDGLENVVWICWAQDPMPHILSKETVWKLGNRDVTISNFGNWIEFQQLGYSKERLISGPIPANHNIYQPYVLNSEEVEKYGCDICVVCHASNAEKYVDVFTSQFDEEMKILVQDLYLSYIMYARDTGQIFIRLEEFRLYVQEFFEKFYNKFFRKDFIDYLSKDMRSNLNYRLYRSLMVDWLMEAGYHNIKLWGNGWKEIEKYSPYAMGVAENGVILSKILQASKIVLGNNIALTGAARVAETLLSGVFYMENYVPHEADMVDIRLYLQEGKEIIMFRDKEDFLGKVDFYLNHENERERIIELGRKKALEKLTYSKFMYHVIEELGKMF